jgi:hypothetical protein
MAVLWDVWCEAGHIACTMKEQSECVLWVYAGVLAGISNRSTGEQKTEGVWRSEKALGMPKIKEWLRWVTAENPDVL